MDDKLTVGSLFAGIGGIELGLERTDGFETVWQVERDDYCRRVLAKHWPDVNRYEDVKNVGSDELREVDLICGGFPCQDISIAGDGEGIGGERSGLWSEMWRIIRGIRPRLTLLENVSALRHRGLGRVLGDLAEIGYDAEWDCLPAAAFGAPHLRDRIFIVATRPEQRRTVADTGSRWGPNNELSAGRDESRVCGATLADTTSTRREARGGDRLGAQGRFFSEAPHSGSGARGPWETEPGVGRVVDGLSNRVDRLRALGNAVVPQVAEWIGEQILRAERT